MQIRSFLETAVNPKYCQNHFHTALFKHHVLQDQDWTDPGIPSYYSRHIFAIIRKVHLDTPINVATMTCSQWYRYLVEDTITMYTVHPRE